MCCVSEVPGVSKEMSLHPVHLVPDSKGHLPPSAFVPLCSYQSVFLGQETPELNLTVCDKFESIFLDGQLCYKLDLPKIGKKPTKEGKENRLFLLMDPKPNLFSYPENERLRLYIHTIHQNIAYGTGTFKLDNLKRMTGTEGFEQLSENKKDCRVHNREECLTIEISKQVQNNCKCVPWSPHGCNKVEGIKNI